MRYMNILPYEITDAFQEFLTNSTTFESFLNSQGYTNLESEVLSRMYYIHRPKQTESISTFPFITFEALESNDERRKEDGFAWNIDIVIGIKDLDEDNMLSNDHKKTTNENIVKYTAGQDIQLIAKNIIETLEEEIEVSGVKGDFSLEFGRISQSTTPTGEFDVVYHGIELQIISYKEI